MFASDPRGLDAHLGTIVTSVRRRAVHAILYGGVALAVAVACFGFVTVEIAQVGPRALASVVGVGAVAAGIVLARFGATTLGAMRLADLSAPETSPVVTALHGDARTVSAIGAVRGRASFVAIVLEGGIRHDLPLAEEEVEPLYRFLQTHVAHARPADLGYRR